MAVPSKTWNTHNYILAALGGTLATTAIVIIISAILRPAHISFSVIHASSSKLSDGDGEYLHLTILANTSQHRTKVKYESIFIDLKNSTGPAGHDMVHAEVDSAGWQDRYLQSTEPAIINASALLVAKSTTIKGFTGGQADNIGLTVVVTAQVHFKVGMARTRLYGIKVFCYSVRFVENSTTTSCY